MRFMWAIWPFNCKPLQGLDLSWPDHFRIWPRHRRFRRNSSHRKHLRVATSWASGEDPVLDSPAALLYGGANRPRAALDMEAPPRYNTGMQGDSSHAAASTATADLSRRLSGAGDGCGICAGDAAAVHGGAAAAPAAGDSSLPGGGRTAPLQPVPAGGDALAALPPAAAAHAGGQAPGAGQVLGEDAIGAAAAAAGSSSGGTAPAAAAQPAAQPEESPLCFFSTSKFWHELQRVGFTSGGEVDIAWDVAQNSTRGGERLAALRYLTARLRENAVLEGLIGKREASMTIDDTGRRQLTLTETRRLSDGGSSAAETVRQLEQAVGIKLEHLELPALGDTNANDEETPSRVSVLQESASAEDSFD